MIRVRNKSSYKGKGIYVGRPSILGNPFTHIKDKKTLAKHVVSNRDASIEQYKEYFKEQMEINIEFRSAIEELVKKVKAGENITLICWCHPLSCHADIIKEYIEKFVWKNKELF